MRQWVGRKEGLLGNQIGRASSETCPRRDSRSPDGERETEREEETRPLSDLSPRHPIHLGEIRTDLVDSSEKRRGNSESEMDSGTTRDITDTPDFSLTPTFQTKVRLVLYNVRKEVMKNNTARVLKFT